jgi:uncharacterized membrane protein YhaH (DUF805 family)
MNLPGGPRVNIHVWEEGRPPRYWVVFAILLLCFVAFWLLTVYFLPSASSAKPDNLHSVPRFVGNRIEFFPAVLVWVVDYGLFVVMVWLFLLGLIMAVKRTSVPKGTSGK